MAKMCNRRLCHFIWQPNTDANAGVMTSTALLLPLLLAVACQGMPSLDELDKLLDAPLQDVPYLHLLLRSARLQEDSDNGYVRWFLQHSFLPISVYSYGDQFTLKWSNRDSCVLATSLTQFNASASRFAQRSGATFFIVAGLQATQQQQQQHLVSIFRQLWTRSKIFNSYVLADDGIWHYDPFARDLSGGYGQLVRYAGREPLQLLLFHDMRGYPLRVQIFKSVYSRPQFNATTGQVIAMIGSDVQVALMLRDQLNFTMQLQEPDKNYFGERTANGSYNGAIGSIIVDGLDICVTGFFVKDYMVADYMDFTVAVYDDELCIYVPKASRIPQSILPIFAVGYDIWVGFILCAFICALIWLVFRLLNMQLGIAQQHGHRLWQQALRILVDTWVVWVRVNVSRWPGNYSERIFVVSLCLVSVIFGAIFESSLATVYIHPLHYKDIYTMQELDDSGLPVVYKYTSMADDLFFSETSPLFAALNKKLQWNKDLDADIMLEVATVGKIAGVTRYSSLMMESYHFLLTKRIWMVPECPKYYTMSYVMPKDAPWSEAVNTLLLRLLNAGIIGKLIADMKSKVDIKLRERMLEASAEGDTFRMLNILDLQLAFYVVLGGNLLACFSYATEIWWARRSENQKTNEQS